MDKILLNQMQFYGYHGLFPEEKRLGQRFIVDAQLHMPLSRAGRSDDMDDSIDYGEAYNVIRTIVEGESLHLIEAVAEKIADDLLAQFHLLEACVVKVTKPDPPIPGQYHSVAVEVFRERKS